MSDMSAQSLNFERLSQLPRPVLLVLAARLKTLGLSLTPVAAGSFIAAQMGGWRLNVMLAAMLAAMMIQIGTNLWNDAADGQNGGDGPARLGPARMTGLGLLCPALVRRVALAAFGLAALSGLWLVSIGGWPIIAVGLVSLALGYFYSMGPRPLSHTALGEALVLLFFGVIAVAGTVYLHGQMITITALMLGLVIGLPAAAVLLVNNHRDRDLDAVAGRRTLAIVIGKRATRTVFGGFLTAALIGAIWLVGGAVLPLLPAALAGGVLTLMMARTPVSSDLNRLIAGTVGFQFLLVLGIIAAWAISSPLPF